MGCSTSTTAAVHEDVVIGKPVRRNTLSVKPACQLAADYAVAEIIGKGSYGTVRIASPKKGEKVRAIKILDAKTREMREEAETEVMMWWLSQGHPNIVELLGCYKDESNHYMVMEHCSGGTLHDVRNVFYTYTEHTMARMFQEMMASIRYVHSAGVLHRDIKPANFLMGGSFGEMIKLADFGMAALMPNEGMLEGCCGTPPYMSPEMAASAGHSLPTDIWSFGATCYTLVMREYPYRPAKAKNASKSEALKISIVNNVHPPLFERDSEVGVSDTMANFLRQLLNRDPQMRAELDLSQDKLSSLWQVDGETTAAVMQTV